MRLPFRALASAGALVAALAIAACSSDSSSQPAGQCNENPFTCPSGTTCWVADDALDMQCLTSAPAKAGDPCQNSKAHATCGDGMFCLEQPPLPDGTLQPGICTAYCDPAHPCAAPATCTQAQLSDMNVKGKIVNICFAGYPSSDAGPPHDASSDAPSTTDAAPPVDAAPTDDGAADAATE